MGIALHRHTDVKAKAVFYRKVPIVNYTTPRPIVKGLMLEKWLIHRAAHLDWNRPALPFFAKKNVCATWT